MADTPKLARIIFTQYRDNFGLFWRIMIPIAIVAIALNVTRFKKSNSETFSANGYTTVSSVSTIDGVYPKLSLIQEKVPSDTSVPDVSWRLLPKQYLSLRD